MRRILAIVLWLLIPCAVQAQYSPRLGNLRDQVRARLGHPDASTFPDSTLRHFINEAMIRVAIDCGSVRKLDTITTVMGTAFYTANTDAIEGWPVDVIGYNPAYTETKEVWWGLKWLIPQAWTWANEDKETYFTGYVHATQIVVFPPPNKSDGKLYIFYRAIPTVFTGEGDTTSTCSVAEVDRPGVVHYAAFLASSSIEWVTKAETEKAEYDRHVSQRQRDMAQPRGVGPQKPVEPSGPVQP